MTTQANPTASPVDSYLAGLRAALGPMTLADREEIVREIAAHIRDSAAEHGDTEAAVVARLGLASALAAEYRDGLLIRRASRSISPILLLRAAARLATRSAAGVLVFFLGAFGYLIGGGMVLSAMLKPILPYNTGMWMRDGVLVGFGTQLPGPPAGSTEVLGLWYIPILLIAGSLLLLATMYIIRTSLRISRRFQSRLGSNVPHAA